MFKKITKSGKKFIKNKSYRIFYYNKCLEKCDIDEFSILLDSQQGKNLDGNIFYLLKELNNEKYKSFKKYVGVSKDYYREFKKKIDNYGIKDYELVIYRTHKYYKVLATAKYLFNDSSFLYFFRKRKGQIYFNTWHGTPYKNMGRSMEEDFYAIGNVQKNLLLSDYLLLPNDYMECLMIKDFMLSNIGKTKIFKSGYPRIEVFFNEERRNKLRKELQIDDKEVILYMPTWRGKFRGIGSSVEEQIILYNKYLKSISKKLKKNQIMYVNFHPFLKDKIILDSFKNIKTIDRKYETYDFLNLADVLITDYSSVFFDFAITKKKIILFTYDMDEYFSVRGAYFNIEKLPFPKVKNINDLIREINNKNINNYDDFIDTYLKYESIDSSKKILDYVLFNEGNIEIKDMPNNNKPNILVYSGNLNKNGITASLLALINKIDLDKYNIYISYFTNTVRNNKNIIKNFDSRINYFPISNRFIGTKIEKIFSIIYKMGLLRYNRARKILDRYYQNESERCYGNIHFDSVIQYSGYGNDISTMYSVMDGNKLIYVHSNMEEEIKLRKNQTRNVLKNVYNKYDQVVIVNELLREPTERISDNSKNIININNVINDQEIINKSKMDISFDSATVSNISVSNLKKVLHSKDKKIVSIGRFSPEKGYDRLIDAFLESDTSSYLIIIGGFGPLYNSLCEKVENSNKRDRIVLIKSLSNPYPILKKCDGMVISSYYEGLPMVLYEAIVLDVPVISTKIPTIEKFFKDYKGGSIVDNSKEGLKNAITMLENNDVKKITINFNEYNSSIIRKLDEVLNMKKESKNNAQIIKKNNIIINKNIKKLKKINAFCFIIIFMFIFVFGYSFFKLKKLGFINKWSFDENKLIEAFDKKLKRVENVHNASNKLDLIDAYGENQPTHPKIINFDKKWNGFKYWMVYSPYPHSDDKKENPHIVVSNDLINWSVPDGLINPLDNTDYDYENMVTYLSDPHLVYNDKDDILECYYRKVDDKHDTMILYRMTSKDGVNWSERDEILRTTRSEHDYVSPAIIYDEGIYKIWYVNKDNKVCYAESEDGYNYSDCQDIKLDYPLSVKTWHLDVIKTENGYEMLTVAYINWNDRARMNLYYFRSDDETSFNEQGIIVMTPSNVSWDNRGFYRSSFIYENGKYYLIYSGISKDYERGLGLSYGENIDNLIGSNLEESVIE